MLLRHARCVLSRLHCNRHSLLLSSYLSRIGRIENSSCSARGHLSSHSALSSYGLCAAHSLSLYDLWSRPWGVARLLGLHGLAPCPHPSEGVGKSTTTLNWCQKKRNHKVSTCPKRTFCQMKILSKNGILRTTMNDILERTLQLASLSVYTTSHYERSPKNVAINLLLMHQISQYTFKVRKPLPSSFNSSSKLHQNIFSIDKYCAAAVHSISKTSQRM